MNSGSGTGAVGSPPVTATATEDAGADARTRARGRDAALIIGMYAAIFVVLLTAANMAYELLPVTEPPHGLPRDPPFSVLARWDSGWYVHIADRGYFYNGPGQQAATAFFPAYPAAVRVTSWIVQNTIAAGIAVTIVSAIAAMFLLFHWTERRFGRRAAWMTVVLFALYPFSYFLFGYVYSDALFLVSTLGAFVLLERDKPLLAGIVGAVAVAGRPVGLAVVVGLAAVALQRRGSLRAVRLKDAAVLVAGLGFVAFVAFLWWRFDEPLAFTKVQTAAGWNREVSLEMIAKIDFYRRLKAGWGVVNAGLALQAILSVLAVACIPLVWRRAGWGYAIYVAAVLGIPLATSSDFVAMGRYILPAFPVFAVVGDALSRRRVWAPAVVLTVNTGLLLYLTTLFARWYLIS